MTVVNRVDGSQILAPGCFGAASVYAQDSKVCQGCGAYQECGPEALHTLEAIRDRVNVSDLLKRHMQARAASSQASDQAQASEAIAAPSAKPAPVVKPIERTTKVVKVSFDIDNSQNMLVLRIANLKAKDLAVSLCKAGVMTGMLEQLHAGKNPMHEQEHFRHVRVACDLLLAGGFTRANLKQTLMQSLGWSDGTAGSHVSQVVTLLQTFAIVKLSGEQFVLADKKEP